MDDNSMQDINENLGMVTYIMLGRIYDMLTIIADGVGRGEEALRLMNLHSQGEIMASPPSLNIELDDEPIKE